MTSLPQMTERFLTQLHVNPVCWAVGSRSQVNQSTVASHDVVCCPDIQLLQLQNDLLKVLSELA